MNAKPVLFFDVETTGKADFRRAPSDPCQPRVVQVAAVLTDPAGLLEFGSFCALVRPEGWTVPPEAEAIHGISTERCERFGVPAADVFRVLSAWSERAGLIVAHNVEFDDLMLAVEWHQLDPTPAAFGEGVPRFCTMHAATDVCRLPGKYGSYKWPSLAEAHRHLCGADVDGAHDAMADAQACRRIFAAMEKRKVAALAAEGGTLWG